MKQKTKQPVQAVKREEPGSKGKEVVRSATVRSPLYISNLKTINAVAKSEEGSFFPSSIAISGFQGHWTLKDSVLLDTE
jgi:hypothetical protein